MGKNKALTTSLVDHLIASGIYISRRIKRVAQKSTLPNTATFGHRGHSFYHQNKEIAVYSFKSGTGRYFYCSIVYPLFVLTG